MTESDSYVDELQALVDAACNGALAEQDAARLEQLLCGNIRAQQFYLTRVRFDTLLRWKFSDEVREPTPSSPLVSYGGLLGGALHGTFGYLSSGWPVAYMVATVILGVGLLVGGMMRVSTPVELAGQTAPKPSSVVPSPSPKMEFVGRITGMIDCHWSDPETAVIGPVAVPLGRKYALASGLMEITYDAGAKVILQGPCTYEVESKAGGYLSVGKLTARVEKNSDRDQSQRALTLALSQGERGPDIRSSFLIPHSYFAVRTPTAVVTDLGTEFGVEVDKEGCTTSHVFRGSVELRLAAVAGQTQSTAQVLHEEESARVERGEKGGDSCLIVVDASTKPADFVRKLVQPPIKVLDLVDVVAGGSGFSGWRGRGIDQRNGQPVTALTNENPIFGDGKYHRVEGMPLVDGVFIPHGGAGPVQLDSAGHGFEGFPTTDNKSCDFVWAGQLGNDSAELGGTDYASAGHGQIALSANKGITFDLVAIRHANPEWRLVRFRAVGGNTELVSEKGADAYADLWVFVDGQVRFRRREINRYNGAMPIIIPINDDDRFLTLVATDGGNGYNQDHIMFGDPRLELAPADAATVATPPRDATDH